MCNNSFALSESRRRYLEELESERQYMRSLFFKGSKFEDSYRSYMESRAASVELVSADIDHELPF